MGRTGSDGKGLTPDKKLFEKYREQKEEEIEQMAAVHEVRCQPNLSIAAVLFPRAAI